MIHLNAFICSLLSSDALAISAMVIHFYNVYLAFWTSADFDKLANANKYNLYYSMRAPSIIPTPTTQTARWTEFNENIETIHPDQS